MLAARHVHNIMNDARKRLYNSYLEIMRPLLRHVHFIIVWQGLASDTYTKLLELPLLLAGET
jgi:hypothetical protein